MDNIETDAKTTTWHYVMDIHNPENIWYSLLEDN